MSSIKPSTIQFLLVCKSSDPFCMLLFPIFFLLFAFILRTSCGPKAFLFISLLTREDQLHYRGGQTLWLNKQINRQMANCSLPSRTHSRNAKAQFSIASKLAPVSLQRLIVFLFTWLLNFTTAKLWQKMSLQMLINVKLLLLDMLCLSDIFDEKIIECSSTTEAYAIFRVMIWKEWLTYQSNRRNSSACQFNKVSSCYCSISVFKTWTHDFCRSLCASFVIQKCTGMLSWSNPRQLGHFASLQMKLLFPFFPEGQWLKL